MLHYEERNSCSWFPSFVHALASGRGRLNPLVLMVGATSCITELPNTLHFARARERGRGQQLEILSHLNICWRSNSALQWLRKKNSYHRGYDGKSCCVCTHSTQMVTWIETTWYHLGTIWTTLGHHLGQLGDHKLAPLGNYMDNTWVPLKTTWRHIATILGQHCLVTVGGAYLFQYGHVLVNAWPEPAMPPLTNLSGDPV